MKTLKAQKLDAFSAHLPALQRSAMMMDLDKLLMDLQQNSGICLTEVDPANNLSVIDCLAQAGFWDPLNVLLSRTSQHTAEVKLASGLLPSFVEHMMKEGNANDTYLNLASRFDWAAWHDKKSFLNSDGELSAPGDELTLGDFLEELIVYAISTNRWQFNYEMASNVTNVDHRLTICAEQYCQRPDNGLDEHMIDIMLDAFKINDVMLSDVSNKERNAVTMSCINDIQYGQGKVIYNSNNVHTDFDYTPFMVLVNGNALILVKGEHDFEVGEWVLHATAYKVHYASAFAF